MNTQSIPPSESRPHFPTLDFTHYVETAQKLSTSMTRWNDERAALLAKARMTKADVSRVRYLNSALDSYSMVLGEYLDYERELPTGSWIDKANRGQA